MPTLGGVTYTEEYDRRTETFDSGSATVQQTLICDYSQRMILAKYLLGFQSGTTWKPPETYVAEGAEPTTGIYCASVEISGAGAPAEAGVSYNKAKLRVTYRNPEYGSPEYPGGIIPGETTYVTESLEPSAEYITLPTKDVYLRTDDGSVPTYTSVDDLGVDVPSKIVILTDWVYTIHQLASLDSYVLTLPGKVNSAAVRSLTLGLTFGAETLLCGNPTLEREYRSTGVTFWRVTFRFTYRPDGWNKFPAYEDTGTGSSRDLIWSQLYDASGNVRTVYEPAAFTIIPPIALA